MSLYDLMPCTCGHARHRHVGQWTKDIGGNSTYHYGPCRHGGCKCKGFLDARPSAVKA